MKLETLSRRLALILALALLLCFGGTAEEASALADACSGAAEAGAGEDFEVLAPPADEVVPEAAEVSLPSPEELLPGDGGATAGEQGEPSSEAGDAATDRPAAEDGAGDGTQADDSREPEPPAMERTSLTLGVKEKYTLTLSDGVTPKGVGARFTSSNPKVASVSAATGVVTGKKVGTATVTVRVGEAASTCEVRVLKAPAKVALSSAKQTLGVGEERSLSVKLPKNTASAITFSSSNPKVATVDGDGHIVTIKKGTATITAKTYNGKKATCKVTVKAAPKTITLGASALQLWIGESYKLSATLSKNSVGAFSYSVSDEAVASVSGDTLKALAEGVATVTATTYNGKTDELRVEVSRRPTYRALLVGESTFPGTGMNPLPGKKDVAMMKKMLTSVKGAAGSPWLVTARTDRTAAQIRNDILYAFDGAEEGDVSLFYISTHGDQNMPFDDEFSEYAGCLQTYPDYNYSNWYDRNAMMLPELASLLAEVPGQVVVLIDSCGSGAAIYTPQEVSAPAEFEPDAFDRAVVEAFEAKDMAVMAPGMEQGAFVVANKFYVLTSAAYLETGWSAGDKYSYFTKWLTDGVGTKGAMAADSNRNKTATLDELYDYINACAAKKVFRYEGMSFTQHVQIYPYGSGLRLFYRK